jgi:hypothetical protein
MTHKKQKASARLGYRVGQNARKNSQHHANISDKSTAKINAKQSLTMQNNLLQWFQQQNNV